MAGLKNSVHSGNGCMLGFEATLWAAVDKLRGNVDAAEYKHVVLGLILLKYISDAFEEQHVKLVNELGADPEDRHEYLALNIFWVPAEARWSHLQDRAKQPTIGKDIDHGRHRTRQLVIEGCPSKRLRPSTLG